MRGRDKPRPEWTVLFLFAAVYLMSFLAAFLPVQEPDFWWHLASGRYILSHHAVPRVDVFSWTAAGTPWIDSYWIYDALIYLLYTAFQIKGLVVFHALLVVGTFACLQWRMTDKNVSWLLILIGMLLVLAGGAPAGGYWGIEASLVSLAFFSFLITHLDRLSRPGWHPSVWAWPVLFVLWANLHRGFMIGLVVVALYAVETAYRSREWFRHGVWLMACVLAPWINPYGPRLFTMIRDDLTLSVQWIIGWDRPLFGGIFVVYYLALLLSGIVLIHRLKLKQAGWWWPWVMAVFLAWESLRHLVYVPYFMVSAIPLLAMEAEAIGFSRILTRSKEMQRNRWVVAATGSVLVISAAAHAMYRAPLEGTLSDAFPFIRAEKINGAFYNDYGLGGYWVWAFDGQPGVFIDGRYPAVEGYKPLMEDLLQARRSAADWRIFLNRYPIKAALVTYRANGPLTSVFRAMFPRDQWALVYWDDVDALFLRRGTNESVIARHEFSAVWPDTSAPAFIQELRQATPPERKAIAGDLFRNVALHPSSHRAQALMALFLKHHLDR